MTKETVKQKAAALRKVFRVMQKGGLAGGKEIARLAKRKHPGALCVVPLYRSCMVVLKPKGAVAARGAVEMILYHDPCWMGGDRTVRALDDFKQRLIISGQRSGPNIYRDGKELLDIDLAIRLRNHEDKTHRQLFTRVEGTTVKAARWVTPAVYKLAHEELDAFIPFPHDNISPRASAAVKGAAMRRLKKQL